MRLAVSLALALALCGCSRPAPVPVPSEPSIPALAAAAPIAAEQAAVAEQPLPQAVESAAQTVVEPLLDAIEAVAALTPAETPPQPVQPVVAAAAVALIVRWEVTSPEFYTRRLIRPIWPGGASGVTWCIGYDGGHQTHRVILEDWQAHPQGARLASTAGIRGSSAKVVVGQFRDILTPYEQCVEVFSTRTLVEYERRTRRAFRDGYDDLRPLARGALVSLVYNRGAAMSGDSRAEMRVIRDDCVPTQDYSCIASQLRQMRRLWKGTVNERGLGARREAEAQLVETN